MDLPSLRCGYEGKIKGGNILISVHAETGEALQRGESVFRVARAEDICTTYEASVPPVA